MQPTGRLNIGGGLIGALTPQTILYGKGNYITELNYNNISINRLVFQSPLTITKRIISGTLNSSNDISIDTNLIYYKNEINSLFQYKLNNGLGININNNSNISVNFSDGGWTSNLNKLYTYSNIGIGINEPSANLHIYNNNPSFIIENPNSSFNISITNDNYLSFNNKVKINKNAINNTLIVDENNIVIINSNLRINGNLKLYSTNNNIFINDIEIISWLTNSNNIASQDFVKKNQILDDSSILYGIGSNITNIDYNNIKLNKLIFNSPLFINENNNVSINTSLLGWTINNNLNTIYTSYNNYNLGIGNTNPLSYLHIGNYINTDTNINNDPSIIISKINNDNNFKKNFKIGIDNDLNLSIGNFNIDTNCNLNNKWTEQFIINNNAKENSIIIDELDTKINTDLILNSNININNSSSIIFNNKFNINYNDSNLNINNFLFINNSCNIGIGTAPNNLNRLIINGNINILSNINSSNINSSNATIIRTLNTSNIRTSNITILDSINTNNLIISGLFRATNLIANSNINSSNIITDILGVNNLITSRDLRITNLAITSTLSNIGLLTSRQLNVSDIIKSSNIINSTNIITNDLESVNSISTKDLIVNNELKSSSLINSGLLITNDLKVNNTINSTIINSDNITNTGLITTNDLIITNSLDVVNSKIKSSIIENTNTITTNDLIVNSTINCTNNIINSKTIRNNNDISTLTINITNATNTNSLTATDNIYIGTANNKNIRSFLQIYDTNTIGNKYSFIISGLNNNFRFGYDTNLNQNFILGSFNNNNNIWRKQLIINNNAPDNSLIINGNGNVGIGTIINDVYKLNINGNLNATNIFQNGENIITSNILDSYIDNKLLNYTNNTNLNINYPNKTYLDYIIDNNNTTLQNYFNNFLTITTNVYSPILKYPEISYDPLTYFNDNSLKYYFNNNFYSYRESFNIIKNNNSIEIYEIYSSSVNNEGAGINKLQLFNYNDNKIRFSTVWKFNNYNTNGIFISGSLINNNIFTRLNELEGDYIIIKLPKKLILNKFRFYSIQSSLTYAPGNWKCIYSTDDNGTNWQELASASVNSSLNRIKITDYKLDIYDNYYYEKQIINNDISSFYIGFIFNRLVNKLSFNYPDINKIRLEISRIELFFTEFAKPIYISSNVLDNYLDNYSTINLLNTKQDRITVALPLSLNGTHISINPNFILDRLGNNIDTETLKNLIIDYINSSANNIWSNVNIDGFPQSSIFFSTIGGSVGIGTTNPDAIRYKLDVAGNINCSNINIINNINASIINANSFAGNGLLITGVDYNNIINRPNINNINNIIYNVNKNNYYTSNNNATFSIGYDFNNINFRLAVNGSILAVNNINALNNIQENYVNLSDKYLTILNASRNYLSNSGGNLDKLTIGLNNNYNDPNYKLVINGNVNCLNTINSVNYYINNIDINNIFISKIYANQNYLSIFNGGTIYNDVIFNNYISIGARINYLYRLNVDGNINSFSNIYANNFIENGNNLSDKYLSILNASIIYFKNTGGIINGNVNINGYINASNIYSNNILLDFNSYLTNTNFNNTIALYPTLNYLNNNYITSNDLTTNYFTRYSTTGNDPNYLKINSGGAVSGTLNVTSNVNIGFSIPSIPLNPNYLLNINGGLNASNIYSNNILIDFNSYLTNTNFNNTIILYATLNYLNNNYITSNDLTTNYFTRYSTTGNDPNYFKINSSGRILNNSNLITSNIITSNIITSNIITSNIITSNLITSLIINTSNLISSNIINSNLISSLNINTSNLNTSNINCRFDISSINFIENGSNLKNKYMTINDTYNNFFNINTNNFILGNNILNYNLNINGTINSYSNIIEKGSNLEDKYLMINNLTSTFNNNIYNFVNLQKKFGFRVICNIPVILNDVTYYKFDINISKYIKDRTDSLNSNPYRIFNIKCFTIDTVFDTGVVNKAPNILQYDIYMSLLQPNNNVNVTAIGFPTNYYLTRITVGDIFILKTSNYNFLSILSRIINTKITCIISDILF